jgi:hypothetical protein
MGFLHFGVPCSVEQAALGLLVTALLVAVGFVKTIIDRLRG